MKLILNTKKKTPAVWQCVIDGVRNVWASGEFLFKCTTDPATLKIRKKLQSLKIKHVTKNTLKFISWGGKNWTNKVIRVQFISLWNAIMAFCNISIFGKNLLVELPFLISWIYTLLWNGMTWKRPTVLWHLNLVRYSKDHKDNL